MYKFLIKPESSDQYGHLAMPYFTSDFLGHVGLIIQSRNLKLASPDIPCNQSFVKLKLKLKLKMFYYRLSH